MKQEPIKVEIAQDSVQQIIAAHVQTAVLAALLPHKEQLVRELVERSLLSPTRAKEYEYKRDSEKPTELEHMVRTIIAEEARKGIIQWAEAHREQIATGIQQAMARKGFGRSVALKLAQDLAEAKSYQLHISVLPLKES